MLPYFLGVARDWRDAADRLRARGVPEGHPALGVWREAAWCHLLFARGLRAAALARLRAVVRGVTGVCPPLDETAAELFARLRAAVSARFPDEFDPPSPPCVPQSRSP
jgi:hypothetical protein